MIEWLVAAAIPTAILLWWLHNSRLLTPVTNRSFEVLRPQFWGISDDNDVMAAAADDPYVLGYVSAVVSFHIATMTNFSPARRRKHAQVALAVVFDGFFPKRGDQLAYQARDAIARRDSKWMPGVEAGIRDMEGLHDAIQRGDEAAVEAITPALVKRLLELEPR